MLGHCGGTVADARDPGRTHPCVRGLGRPRRLPDPRLARHARMPTRTVAARGAVHGARRLPRDARPRRLRTVDRRPGRTVADEVEDVRSLADELGFDRFGVTGGSGGGPHSLACAALLPDRVVRATCRVGVAPLGDPGPREDEWLAGMDSENVKEFSWARAGEEVLAASSKPRKRGSGSASRSIRRPLSRIRPQRFRSCAALAPGDDADHSRIDGRALRNGVGGWVDDDLAFLTVGFDVAAISVPVLVWYGARTCSCLPRTASGSPRTSPAVSSRSTMSPATWAMNPVEEITQNSAG